MSLVNSNKILGKELNVNKMLMTHFCVKRVKHFFKVNRPVLLAFYLKSIYLFTFWIFYSVFLILRGESSFLLEHSDLFFTFYVII